MALSPSFAGVILAAGASSRMGRDKALLPWRDGTFLSAGIRALQPATDLVMVVAGADAACAGGTGVDAQCRVSWWSIPIRNAVSSVPCNWDCGKCSIAGATAAIITLVDRPRGGTGNRPADKSGLSGRRRADVGGGAGIFRQHGHPYVIGREMIEAFLRAPVTSSARDVEHAQPATHKIFSGERPAGRRQRGHAGRLSKTYPQGTSSEIRHSFQQKPEICRLHPGSASRTLPFSIATAHCGAETPAQTSSIGKSNVGSFPKPSRSGRRRGMRDYKARKSG